MTHAMFLGSSQKVTCRSVVEVGAAVVDCGITTDTAAVSEMRRILDSRHIGIRIQKLRYWSLTVLETGKRPDSREMFNYSVMLIFLSSGF